MSFRLISSHGRSAANRIAASAARSSTSPRGGDGLARTARGLGVAAVVSGLSSGSAMVRLRCKSTRNVARARAELEPSTPLLAYCVLRHARKLATQHDEGCLEPLTF